MGAFPTRLTLLMPAFALPMAPAGLTAYLLSPRERSPTDLTREVRRSLWSLNPIASVVGLSPVTLSAQNHSTSELLRTLLRVAASKPTSWLFGRSYILSHLAYTWGP